MAYTLTTPSAEDLPSWTLKNLGASTLTFVRVKQLWSWTLLACIRTDTLAVHAVKLLCLSAGGSWAGTFALAFVAVKTLVSWALQDLWAAAFAYVAIKYLRTWALHASFGTNTLASVVIEKLRSRALHASVGADTLASVVIENLRARALHASVGADTLASPAVKFLCTGACRLWRWTFAAAGLGIEKLQRCTSLHMWAPALTSPLIEHLGIGACWLMFANTCRSWG